MLNILIRIIAALLLTIASAWINPPTSEYAMYGNMGPPEQNWQPREVAGWPAPYLADCPGTSVIHQVGLEDEFRPDSFIATLSFWFVAILILDAMARRCREIGSGSSADPNY